MAELIIDGRTTVRKLKADFKAAFGCSLRVYMSVTCKGRFADNMATLASIRAKGAKGGTLTVKGNKTVGKFEAEFAETWGIGVQVANADDTRLADDGSTLCGAAENSGPAYTRASHKDSELPKKAPEPDSASEPELEEIEKDGKKGYVDKSGNVVIPCIYDFLYGFRNGLAKGGLNGKSGVINDHGKVIIPFEYDDVDDHGNCFVLKKNGKYGLASFSGKLLTSVDYDDYNSFMFKGKIILVKNSGVYEAYEDNGTKIKKLPYDKMGRVAFEENGLVLVGKGGKWGYINNNLEEVVPCKNVFVVAYVDASVIYDRRSESFFEGQTPDWMSDFIDYNKDELGRKTISQLKKYKEFNKSSLSVIFSSEVLPDTNFVSSYLDYGPNRISYVESVKLRKIKGDAWYREYYADHRFDKEFDGEEVKVKYQDIDIINKGLQYLYTEGQFGYYFQLLIPDVSDFDPSKLVIEDNKDNSRNDFMATYDGMSLPCLGDGRPDIERHIDRRLFINGEEVNLEK